MNKRSAYEAGWIAKIGAIQKESASFKLLRNLIREARINYPGTISKDIFTAQFPNLGTSALSYKKKIFTNSTNSIKDLLRNLKDTTMSKRTIDNIADKNFAATAGRDRPTQSRSIADINKLLDRLRVQNNRYTINDSVDRLVFDERNPSLKRNQILALLGISAPVFGGAGYAANKLDNKT